ncbi:MAG: hypothetical protein ACP5M0_03110 [Desulfomonilaceae bacterium]
MARVKAGSGRRAGGRKEGRQAASGEELATIKVDKTTTEAHREGEAVHGVSVLDDA